MRYIQLTDHTDGTVFVAATSEVADSVMLHRILCELMTSKYTVKFDDKPIRTGVRGKFVVDMDHLFNY